MSDDERKLERVRQLRDTIKSAVDEINALAQSMESEEVERQANWILFCDIPDHINSYE